MKRKDFLRLSGLVSGAALLSFSNIIAAGNETNTCTLLPSEDEGPFPYPGGEISNPLQITDVRGGQTGVQLDIIFNVIDAVTCSPIENVRVDIWHCNKDGDYSGYGNFTSVFWLRGFQYTNPLGQAMFTTIYPGWYPGRATHIHMEFFYNNVMVLHSQMAFDETISNAVHISPLYAAHGINTTTNAADGILGNSAADLATETVALTGNITSGYSGNFTVALSGITGMSKPENKIENISAYPSPVTDKLLVTHSVADANTTVKVMNINGRIVATGKLNAGSTTTNIDISTITKGVYILELENKNSKQMIKFVKM